MALILDSLYDALKAAGASEEKARAAARDVAGHHNRLHRMERDLALLKWMVGAAIAIQIGLFWMQWHSLDRLAALDARMGQPRDAPSAGGRSAGPDRDPPHRGREPHQYGAFAVLTLCDGHSLTASGPIMTAPGPEE
jgi:hypothetical protein